MNKEIKAYNQNQSIIEMEICDLLATNFDLALTESTSKIWHAHPVWFLGENPVVGYSKRKNGIHLLFWSGQSFNETNLDDEGKFKAAGKYYTALDQIDVPDLKRWLEKSEKIQWDYKNIVKRKGQLERLT